MHDSDDDYEWPPWRVRPGANAPTNEPLDLPVDEDSEEPRPDEGPGRPKQIPLEAHDLTEEERTQIAKQAEEEAKEEIRLLEEQIASQELVIPLPPLLANRLTRLALLVVLAVFGLFLVAQITSTLSALATFPAWLQWVGGAVLVLLTCVVVYGIIRFLFFYFRLKPNQPIRVKVLEQLAQRAHLRRLAQIKKTEAKDSLEAYLRDYPLEEADARKTRSLVGLDEGKIRELKAARTVLLDRARFANHAQWFADFRTRFQVILDTAADARVKRFARRAGVATAASPNALVDTLLTLSIAVSMLKDLCVIYNLRANRVGTYALLVRVFFNAYLAGRLDELEDVTGEGIRNLIQESDWGSWTSFLHDATFARIAGKVGAAASSGLLNYYMIKRLGRYAVRLLRPIHTE